MAANAKRLDGEGCITRAFDECLQIDLLAPYVRKHRSLDRPQYVSVMRALVTTIRVGMPTLPATVQQLDVRIIFDILHLGAELTRQPYVIAIQKRAVFAPSYARGARTLVRLLHKPDPIAKRADLFYSLIHGAVVHDDDL